MPSQASTHTMLTHTGLHTHTYPLSEQMTPGCYFLLSTEDTESAFEPHIQGASPPTSVCASSLPVLLLRYRHSMWRALRRLPSPISMCVSFPPQESLLTMTFLYAHPLYPHGFCSNDCSLTKHNTKQTTQVHHTPFSMQHPPVFSLPHHLLSSLTS